MVREGQLEDIRTLVEGMNPAEFKAFYDNYTNITHGANRMAFFYDEMLPVSRAIEPVTKVIVGEWVRRKKRGWGVNE